MPGKEFIDQMGCKVRVPKPIQSIVSLVPSQTELLFDLGLGEQIKGITKFCVHPTEKVKDVTKIGGTKNFHYEAIEKLNPDLIIGNKEENYEEGINRLKTRFPVWMSDIYNLTDAKKMIEQVAHLVDRAEEGKTLVRQIADAFSILEPRKPKRTLYFIWRKPFMVAGKNTFIDCMLQTVGLENIVKEERYPELTPEDVKTLNPDLILLSSEPYPFKPKHGSELLELCPNAAIHIVDGEMFSWYGSRLKKAPEYFNSLNF